ncbi:MAG: HAMP domain-containing histidine kinase [Candidatus Margulisbacteria bacterium]|nr:HAMP domain-containing histidine kinase [Candidatus Margulisiibacteriota bacterium]
MPKQISEQEFQQVLNDFYNEIFLELISQFIDKLDILQKEHEMLRERHEFIDVMSHQLRTPISTCRYNLEILEESIANTEHSELADSAHEKIISLNSLVDNLLFYIEVEGKQGVGEKEEFSLSDLVKKNIKLLEQSDNQKKIRIRFIKPNCNDVIEANEKKIDKVVFFLLDNAVTYNKEGGEVEINITKKENTLRVSVEDSGYGIPKKEQTKIFTEFFRASNASLGKNEGSGVSLYLAKKFAEEENGIVGFKSEENKGSTFFLALPIDCIVTCKVTE